MKGDSVENRPTRHFSAAVNGDGQKERRAAPVSIRFNDAERALLAEHAGGSALGPYIKRYVLDGHQVSGKPKRKSPSKQKQAIARTLRGLGLSGISGILSTLVLAVEEGRLSIEHHEELELRRAIAEVVSIRSDLVAALDVRESKEG
ncbi:MAG: hypothetical protein AAGA97_00570 [Pseudomonadota bacterium]